LEVVLEEKKFPVMRLVDLADAIFERATQVEQGDDFAKKSSEIAVQYREQSLKDCIELWSVIEELAPGSYVDQIQKKRLAKDAPKIISRCYHKLGNLEAARKYITSAIDRGYLGGFISLGAICMETGDFEAAKSAFLSAISKGVMENRAHAGLGELYFKMGCEQLKRDREHKEYFVLAEQEFILAGKAKFTESFDRAIDLFDKIGLKEKAMSIAKTASVFYETNKGAYGEKIRALDSRFRRMTGEDRHDKLVEEMGKKLSKLLQD
jgi:tetratricopeptide (TPR) repeat protein